MTDRQMRIKKEIKFVCPHCKYLTVFDIEIHTNTSFSYSYLMQTFQEVSK